MKHPRPPYITATCDPASHWFRPAVLASVGLGLLLSVWISPVRAATLPPGFTESLVATGLVNPTAMDFAPDGRLFVCQKEGQLRVIKNDTLLAAPFVTVPADSSSEKGLLGITVDP